ncbi:GrdX family protein [Haloplasma contractile]|uniref:GrdX protein n=1 Tax=Haloplasma contractile SSD-17B TaxID=1033810 RepID=U2DY75_9MOLU|nr:GrdX family protein [Haloplasma contractile]ERJ13212.1 GrdX protein [Haloplasma contractile SSD-17B]
MKTVVTNNPLVNKHNNKNNVLYLEDQDYLDVLIKVRDLIQMNYQLVTHPLSSNFLADKTIYKTVVIKEAETLDIQSIEIIEDAVILVRNSLSTRDERIFDDHIMNDLQFVDYEIIKQAL